MLSYRKQIVSCAHTHSGDALLRTTPRTPTTTTTTTTPKETNTIADVYTRFVV